MNKHEQKSRSFIYVRERPIRHSLKFVYIYLYSYIISFNFIILKINLFKQSNTCKTIYCENFNKVYVCLSIFIYVRSFMFV